MNKRIHTYMCPLRLQYNWHICEWHCVMKNWSNTLTRVTKYLGVHCELKTRHSESTFLILKSSWLRFCHHNASFMTLLVCRGAVWTLWCVQQNPEPGQMSAKLLKVNDLITQRAFCWFCPPREDVAGHNKMVCGPYLALVWSIDTGSMGGPGETNLELVVLAEV